MKTVNKNREDVMKRKKEWKNENKKTWHNKVSKAYILFVLVESKREIHYKGIE